MENKLNVPESQILVQLPVKLEYSVLNEILGSKVKGEQISSTDKDGTETKYAEILAISIARSSDPGFDLDVQLKVKALATIFKGRILDIDLKATIQYDSVRQEIGVGSFKLHTDSGNWILNKLIGSIVNSFMYSNLKEKMKFSFKDILEEKQGMLNRKLQDKLEVYDGIFINGAVRDIRVDQVLPGQSFLLISVHLSGSALAEIRRLNV